MCATAAHEARPHSRLGTGVVPQPFARIDWASLFRRVVFEDVLRCPCGGRRRILSDVTEQLASRGRRHPRALGSAGTCAQGRPGEGATWTWRGSRRREPASRAERRAIVGPLRRGGRGARRADKEGRTGPNLPFGARGKPTVMLRDRRCLSYPPRRPGGGGAGRRRRADRGGAERRLGGACASGPGSAACMRPCS
jgi:hypothetical protein